MATDDGQQMAHRRRMVELREVPQYAGMPWL
jgi:hypothetical protein